MLYQEKSGNPACFLNYFSSICSNVIFFGVPELLLENNWCPLRAEECCSI
jgi:hypothetical protein